MQPAFFGRLFTCSDLRIADEQSHKTDFQNTAVTSFDQLPLTLTASQVAAVLSISRVNAYTLMHAKGFPTIRIGKRMIVHRDKLIDWMNARVYL